MQSSPEHMDDVDWIAMDGARLNRFVHCIYHGLLCTVDLLDQFRVALLVLLIYRIHDAVGVGCVAIAKFR